MTFACAGSPAARHCRMPLAWLDAQLSELEAERVPLRESAGRILGCDVVSRHDVPGFQRAMMDGFAVLANDTLGATN